MKRTASLILAVILLSGLFPVLSAGEEMPAAQAFTMDVSALPFAEAGWDAKANVLAKALGAKPEKEGNAVLIRTEVTIEGIGENLPVTYTFRNNKLASVKAIIVPGYGRNNGFGESGLKTRIRDYLTSFIGSHPAYTAASGNGDWEYTFTDVTDMAYGLLKNGKEYDVSMEFYPAQKYDVSALKKNRKIASDGEKDILFYDPDPAVFKHEYTSKMNRFTYSYFNWAILLHEADRETGAVPTFCISFLYAGIYDSGDCNSLSFTLDGTVYRFVLGKNNRLEKKQTVSGETAQTFILQIDCNNYDFLEKLMKARKVRVCLKSPGSLTSLAFSLYFDLPAKSKNKLTEGIKAYQKLCGIPDGPLAFNRFSGTVLADE